MVFSCVINIIFYLSILCLLLSFFSDYNAAQYIYNALKVKFDNYLQNYKSFDCNYYINDSNKLDIIDFEFQYDPKNKNNDNMSNDNITKEYKNILNEIKNIEETNYIKNERDLYEIFNKYLNIEKQYNILKENNIKRINNYSKQFENSNLDIDKLSNEFNMTYIYKLLNNTDSY